MHSVAFESYGVRVCIESNRKRLLDRVRTIAERSLLGRTADIPPNDAEHFIRVTFGRNGYALDIKGEEFRETHFSKGFFNFLESRLRLVVAENAKDLVFLHAGAVAWNGKGILFPADSFQGKTTLIAALIKRGGVYYSDDYAILDAEGRVHPFARRLSIRNPKRAELRSNVSAATLGGVTGVDPIPVAAVIFTKFQRDGKWAPKILSPGNGLMRMIPQTIPVRSNPEFSTNVLKTVASHAIIAESFRCDVKLCINDVIVFIDKLTL